MRPHLFNSNIADENSYLFSSGKEAMIVDPGFNGESLLNYIEPLGLKITKVLLTHGHYDHIRDIRLLAKKHNFTIYIHEQDVPMLSNASLSYATHFGGSFQLTKDQSVQVLKDGDMISFGDEVIEVIHTPGHTAGSVCYLLKPYLFSGDTLFKRAFGRTDLASGSAKDMQESIKKLFERVHKDIYIYPGHDKTSRMSEELEHNLMVRTYMKHK
jgi:hydroxyacylglutathione hydrolase